jgi:phosphate/sulfate permease
VGNDLLLSLVVVTALAFAFTNGFDDTGNARATSIATGALGPRTAVALPGVLNLVRAFLSLSGLAAESASAAVILDSAATIRTAIAAVTQTTPSSADVNRVCAHLAAAGWPLAERPGA